MKKNTLKLFAIAVFAVCCISLTGCGKFGGINDFQFKKMDIAGVNTLALVANESSSKDGEQEIVLSPLYKVSDEGTLVEIEYTIEARGNGEAVEIAKANCRIAMEYVYRIGDDWLRLYNCRYECPGLEDQPASVQEIIQNDILDKRPPDFLVRLSDGALFKWNHDAGAPNLGTNGYHTQKDAYGIMESMDGELFSVTHDHHIVRFVDKGNTLDVTTIISDNISANFIMPTNDKTIGSMLAYSNYYKNYGVEPSMIFPKTNRILSIRANGQGDGDNIKLMSINRDLYMAREADYITYFHKINAETEENNEKVVVSDAICSLEGSTYIENNDVNSISKTGKLSWLDYNSVFTFDPSVPEVTSHPLPLHYPGDAMSYYDGVAYVAESGKHPTMFWECDLAADAAVSHNITWGNALEQYEQEMVMSTMLNFWFNPSCMAFTSSCILTDGRKLTIFIDVMGENMGQVRAIPEGENTAGRVISTLIRLN